MFTKRVTKIHFVGVGGIGMSGIAEVLLTLGYEVSGSDLRSNDSTRRLQGLGGRIVQGHRPENVADADVVVISSAVSEDNVEVQEAYRRKIPVIPRAEMLAELMRLKYGLAVAGTHGKTTTTSLLATVLFEAGLDPTVVIGGKLNALDTNAKLGGGDYMVVEADESDGSFLYLSPVLAVITNIDPEHLDHYGSLAQLEEAFVRFANRVPFYGAVAVCLDHPRVQAIIPRIRKRVLTYGLSAQAEFRAEAIQFSHLQSCFDVYHRDEKMGRIRLNMPGQHNVLNTLAVVALAHELGISFSVVQEALEEFQGVARRFTIRGQAAGVVVVDDYGHHPEEIRTTLAAARQSYPEHRILAVFQPHRYTRVERLWQDFSRAFNQADQVLVCDIYPAGEKPIPGIDAASLAGDIARCGHRAVTYVGGLDGALSELRRRVRSGDLVITLGAGDVWTVGRDLVAGLEAGRE